MNCTVRYYLSATVDEKRVFYAFHFQRFKRKSCVGRMHNKSSFCYYQTIVDCVLNKTQPQPHRQTDSKKVKKKTLLSPQSITAGPL